MGNMYSGGLGTLLVQKLRGLDASLGPTCFCVCQISNYLIEVDTYSYYIHVMYIITHMCIFIYILDVQHCESAIFRVCFASVAVKQSCSLPLSYPKSKKPAVYWQAWLGT